MSASATSPTPEDYARSTKHLRVEFRRRHFSERERLILDWMLDCSLMCGREDMTFPTLESIGALAHISRGNVHTVIAALRGMDVLLVEEVHGVTRYRIQPDSSKWLCRPRLSQDELRFALANIREANGISADLFAKSQEGTRNFPATPIEVFLSAAVPDLKTVSKTT